MRISPVPTCGSRSPTKLRRGSVLPRRTITPMITKNGTASARPVIPRSWMLNSDCIMPIARPPTSVSENDRSRPINAAASTVTVSA